MCGYGGRGGQLPGRKISGEHNCLLPITQNVLMNSLLNYKLSCRAVLLALWVAFPLLTVLPYFAICRAGDAGDATEMERQPVQLAQGCRAATCLIYTSFLYLAARHFMSTRLIHEG